MNMSRLGAGVFLAVSFCTGPAWALHGILPPKSKPIVVSTVPPNGDLNPYGVAFVPSDFKSGGPLQPGDILVSNFNASSNLQGTGTTIVDVRGSTATTFFQGTPPLGLTTALAVLKSGFIIVGNFPSPDGSCTDASAGSLLVIDGNGNLVGTIAGTPMINGPWDMTVIDSEEDPVVFVSNALSGTVYRFNLKISGGSITVSHVTEIAQDYSHQCDPVTFVDGPTGLAYDPNADALYVASTLDNTVYRVSHATTRSNAASKGVPVYSDVNHLNGPLALALAPNGHLITANNDNTISGSTVPPSEYVEFTKSGRFVGDFQIDPNAGGAFGLAVIQTDDDSGIFAAVDDNVPNLQIFKVKLGSGGNGQH
jgi:DNA-binding beta-propeller fold protein YncE